MMSLQPITSWNLYGRTPNRGYSQVNKNEGIREDILWIFKLDIWMGCRSSGSDGWSF
jgi:hypothetical protein